MGVYGAATRARPVNKFVRRDPGGLRLAMPCRRSYAAIMLGTLVLFWVFSLQRPAPPGAQQRQVHRPAQGAEGPSKVLKYCQYYSIVFGGYVALALWMVQYYVANTAWTSAWPLLAPASLPGGVLRAIGGMLSSDKYGAHSVTWWVMWVSWICLFLLSYPQTDFTVLTVNGPKTFHIGLNVYFVFTGIMFRWHLPGRLARPACSSTSATTTPQHRRASAASWAGRRHGRLHPAHPVRRADGPLDRHPLQRLHADVRRGVGLAHLDVLSPRCAAP